MWLIFIFKLSTENKSKRFKGKCNDRNDSGNVKMRGISPEMKLAFDGPSSSLSKRRIHYFQ